MVAESGGMREGSGSDDEIERARAWRRCIWVWRKNIVLVFVFAFVVEDCESGKRRWAMKFEALSYVRLVDDGG